MTNENELKLINDCLGGNIKAFELLIDKYQKPIFNNALRMVKDYEEAQDIAQTVFVKAFEKLDTFNPDYKFFSWIYRMMVNESINFLNKRKQFEELDQSITSPEKNPEELYNDNKLSQTVQEALMELHIEHRVAIVLRHFGNLSYREMSYVLELPEKTVKSRLFSARRVLNKILLKRGVIGND